MEIAEAIKILAGTKVFHQHICKVTEVDETEKTCTVQPVNEDADLQGVRLQAVITGDTGILIIPETDSYVIIGYHGENEAYIIKTSKVKRVEIITSGEVLLNGDEFEGLIKINELTSKLNSLVTDFNGFVAKFNAHIHITTATVSASPVPGVISPTTTPATNTGNFNKGDYENETVKHG